ncbi:carboxylesterase family protein [Sphingomonas sp. RB3P16]|uniref:carboxylesterase/lipase family protein n=1 Tax=Parasphingomonas frigoris TaxID=3096163 RepID=UPI002FC6AEE6
MMHLDRRGFLALATMTALAAAAEPLGAAAPDGLVVTTRQGRVRGRAVEGIRVFTGIPYGQAQRFAAPRAARAWSDVYDATRPAAVAPQLPGMAKFEGAMSEDCLQLNVWAPATPGSYPVLVYIHGGGNETGWSGDQGTAGDRFAAHGVICVTMNYRIGAFGFLETGGLLGRAHAGSANNGMRDVILALRWVRANIAAFGGDPARVTLAGESAGGKNVGTLMGMPAADGLYARTALFSGGAQTVHTSTEAQAFARLFADKLGGADRLATAPVAAMLAAQAAARAAWPRNFPFRPMVDGHDLPDVPLARIRVGRAPRVPMLIGTNADESRLFLPAAAAQSPFREQSLSNETLARMTALDGAYARAFPDLSVAERHWRLLTAEEYGMPCQRIAEGHSASGGAVYRYRWTYPAPGGPFAGHSPHVIDVPFTFDHVRTPAFGGFFGLTAADQPMADAVHQAMVRFVRDGQPVAAGLPVWGRYDATARQTMLLARTPGMASDPDRVERLIWTE